MSGIFIQTIRGAGGVTINIDNATVTSNAATPSQAASLYQLTSAGEIEQAVNGVLTDIGDWVTPKSGMSGYDARGFVTSTNGLGTLTGDLTDNTWRALGSTRVMLLESVGDGSGLCTRTLTVEIRDGTTFSVLDSATITLNATDL